MSALEEVLTRLIQRSFSARVLLNGDESGVVIKYSMPYTMEISGIDPGFKLGHDGVQVYDGTQWQMMNSGQWLNILRLMDPRVYLHKVKEGSQITLPNGIHEVTGSFVIQDIGYNLTDDYIKWLEERNAIKREVIFRFDQDLIEFEQSNLPPFQEEGVTVRIDH